MMLKGIFGLTLFLTAAGYGAFFNSGVRFFAGTRPETKISPKIPQEFIWAEPVVRPDGSIATYVPPAVVTAFLENPTESSAKGYLKWQEERMAKIIRATDVLEKAAGEKPASAPAAGEKPELQTLPGRKQNPGILPAGSVLRILYFAKQGCRYCAAEDLVIDVFNKRYGSGFRITGYWVGSRNSLPKLSFPFEKSKGLEKRFKIVRFPALIFFVPGQPGPVELTGFVDGTKLVRFYEQITGEKI